MILAVVEASIYKQTRKNHGLGKLAGYTLLVGWLIWGAILLYADLKPIPVLVVLFGLMTILVAEQRLFDAASKHAPALKKNETAQQG